jgi:hypothetical protein
MIKILIRLGNELSLILMLIQFTNKFKNKYHEKN